MDILSLTVFFFLVVTCLIIFRRRYAARTQAPPERAHVREKGDGAVQDTTPDLTIEPLEDFDWRATPPLELRPFKSVYHITMALQVSRPSELITMDWNYRDRALHRRQLLQEQAHITVGITPQGKDAVDEVYSYMLGTYLPTRFPSMFSVSANGLFRNHVTEVTYPMSPPLDAIQALKILGETVEDDMFLLRQTDEGHRSIAFVCCHPTGFDPSAKLGKILSQIHVPVPSYDKIRSSMERYFCRLEVGKSVKRTNWSVTMSPDLFSPFMNHIHDGDDVQTDREVNIDQARLRVELQTLTRLPKTRAILFSFKTYMYTLSEIKEEGLGSELADAIDGLTKGNAPGMFRYKSGVIWGETVKAYLRSEV